MTICLLECLPTNGCCSLILGRLLDFLFSPGLQLEEMVRFAEPDSARISLSRGSLRGRFVVETRGRGGRRPERTLVRFPFLLHAA